MSTTQAPAPPDPTRTVLRTESRLFLREIGSVAWIVAFPAVLLVIIGLVPSFRRPDPDLGGQSVVDLYAPVCVILTMLVAAVQAMPGILAGYREWGVLRRLRSTPAHPRSLLGAQVVLHGAASLVGAVLVLAAARIGYGTPLPQQLAGYALALVLTLAVTLAVGATITALSSSVKTASAIGTIVFFPSMFTAGVWLPVQAMPRLMEQVVGLTPLGAAARALNDAAVGDWPRVVDLLVILAWTVVLAAVSVRFFRWE